MNNDKSIWFNNQSLVNFIFQLFEIKNENNEYTVSIMKSTNFFSIAIKLIIENYITILSQ